MQGKEPSERTTKIKFNVGIDVSKSWLDVHVLACGETLRVSNSAEGIRRLKRWLRRFDVTLVVMEATGKWHRPLHRSLFGSAIPVAVVDPYRVRMFAKAQGILAKTDRLDAQLLARYGAQCQPAPTPVPTEEATPVSTVIVPVVTATDATPEPEASPMASPMASPIASPISMPIIWGRRIAITPAAIPAATIPPSM